MPPPSTTSESLVQIGPAIAEPIQDERQDSVCSYLKSSLRSPLDKIAFLAKLGIGKIVPWADKRVLGWKSQYPITSVVVL